MALIEAVGITRSRSRICRMDLQFVWAGLKSWLTYRHRSAMTSLAIRGDLEKAPNFIKAKVLIFIYLFDLKLSHTTDPN